MQKNKQMRLAERDNNKQALKLVAGWRSLKELGLNENSLVQPKIVKHFPGNFLQNQNWRFPKLFARKKQIPFL